MKKLNDSLIMEESFRKEFKVSLIYILFLPLTSEIVSLHNIKIYVFNVTYIIHKTLQYLKEIVDQK